MSHIVLMEEDRLMRSLLTEWLTDAGYRVDAIKHPAAANAADADLVIVDVHNPRDVGLERLHTVRSRHPGAPIVAISGHFRPGVGAAGPAAEALGVERVLAKPIDREAFLDAVGSVVGPPR